MRHIAVEGRCFVLSACQYATKKHYPANHAAQSHEQDEIIGGGSIIVSVSTFSLSSESIHLTLVLSRLEKF